MEISFTCTKIPEALSPNQAYQPHISSAGVCETGTIAAKVAARTKDDPEVIKSLYAITTVIIPAAEIRNAANELFDALDDSRSEHECAWDVD